MEAYQERVVEEAQSLNDKIGKLSEFTATSTFLEMAAEDSGLLVKQLDHMRAYHAVLEKRIARFEATTST